MADLDGLRVLVVEDEGGVALLIEQMLEDLGCVVAASVATLANAIKAARGDTFDFALLDVNLDGELVFPVAEILKVRQRPFIFSTGYGRMGVPEEFKDCEVLEQAIHDRGIEEEAAVDVGQGRLSGSRVR